MKKILFSLLTFATSLSFSQGWQEVSKTTSESRIANGIFGSTIELNNQQLFIGETKNNEGRVSVRKKDKHGIWKEVQSIIPILQTPPNNTYVKAEEFGGKISVSQGYMAISAEIAEVSQSYTSRAGAVYMYKQNGNKEWELTEIITSPPPITEDDYFGGAINLNGDQLIIANREHIASDATGSAYIYKRNISGEWVLQQKINGSDSESWDLFAQEVLIQNDFAIACSDLESQFTRLTQTGDQTGVAYIFKKDAQNVWAESQKIIAPNQKIGAEFGADAVILNNKLYIGAPGEDFNAIETDSIADAGAVYEYTLDNLGMWNFTQKIVSPNRSTNAEFGKNINIHGNQLAVSSYSEITKNSQVYVFELDQNQKWEYKTSATSIEGSEFQHYGNSIAINDKDLLVGTPYNSFNAYESDSLPNSGAVFYYTKAMLFGRVFHDVNANGTQENGDLSLQARIGKIQPGNLTVYTNDRGNWYIDTIPNGSYTLTYDTVQNWTPTNSTTFDFTILSGDTSIATLPHGVLSTTPCHEPNISINMPFMRPCFTDQSIFVEASNSYLATAIISDAYAIVQLDSMLNFESATLPYTDIGDHKYKFELGDLLPSQNVNFIISTQVNCDANLGEVICLQADLFPIDNCAIQKDTTTNHTSSPCSSPYNNSNLVVEARCLADSIQFFVTNTGIQGVNDMGCYSPVRIYIDGVYYYNDSVMLNGNETQVFKFPADGNTWRFEVDQHPDHPKNSSPSATIQTCGSKKRWLSDYYLSFPQDDESPVRDIYCNEVTGSYDPNDKRGFPVGVTDTNFIAPNTDMEYIIRFQNTGTDTAFTVVIRDTLDDNFVLSSLKSSSSSHAYEFKIYGERVLEWKFKNILLPDSNRNEELSHGFIQYKVKQKANLPDYTELNNTAYIYFDFNDPIITNTTSHVVNRMIHQKSKTEYPLSMIPPTNIAEVNVYPNPVEDQLFFDIPTESNFNSYSITDISGQEIMVGQITSRFNNKIKLHLSTGTYLLQLKSDDGNVKTIKFVKSK